MGTFGDIRRRRRWEGGGGRGGGMGGPIRPVFEGRAGSGDKPDYKTAALCKQVARILGMTLSGECADPVLQELVVDQVLPAPNAGRLLARVMVRARPGGPGVLEVLERLAKVEGLLRARIAESIARKRTPELSFDVIPVGLPIGEEGHA